MEIPTNDNLKARVVTENPDLNHLLENVKASLRTAYKLAAKANQKSHQANKKLYEHKAKEHNFNVGNLVYLYNPAIKPVLTRKFHWSWAGP